LLQESLRKQGLKLDISGIVSLNCHVARESTKTRIETNKNLNERRKIYVRCRRVYENKD